jgi:hypothetical protein
MTDRTVHPDRLDVAETVYRYAVGIDTRDWILYRSIFAADVEIDFESYNGVAAATMPADAWVENLVPVFTGLSATQHAMSNPITTVAADAATCRMYIQAHHVLDADDPDSWFTLGGYYDDRLVRDPGAPAGWVLTAVRLTVLWRRGDPGIMPIARQRGLDAR